MNARAYVSLFGFRGSDQQKRVGALSGIMFHDPFLSEFTLPSTLYMGVFVFMCVCACVFVCLYLYASE